NMIVLGTPYYQKILAQLDTKDNFRILRMVPLRYSRVHGIDWDNGAMWVMFSSDYLIHKLDANTGKVLEVLTLKKGQDPDPHGMCLHDDRGALFFATRRCLCRGLASPGICSATAKRS